MSGKISRTTILYLIAALIVLGIIISKRIYNSNKKVHSVKNYSAKKQSESYSNIKRYNLYNIDEEFDTANISVAVFEYRYNETKHALIIRRDSVTFNITKDNTEINNVFQIENIGILSYELLDLLNNNISTLAFQEEQQIAFMNRHRGINIFIQSGNGQIMHLNLDSLKRENKTHFALLELLEALISKVNNSDILIEDILNEP